MITIIIIITVTYFSLFVIINDLINQSLLDLSNDLSLNFVWLNGIGAIKNPEMGYFDIDRKDYDRKIFNGDYELTSYMGNISLIMVKLGKELLREVIGMGLGHRFSRTVRRLRGNTFEV